MKKFGPLQNDALPTDDPCAACKQPFKKGDYQALIPLGPGDNLGERQKAQEGRAYNAVCAIVHYACATGEEG